MMDNILERGNHRGFEWNLVEITWLGEIDDHGVANGYVGIPHSHPLNGVDYDEIDLDIHGGLTFSQEIEGLWVLGFDTAHFGDNKDNCDLEYCRNEVIRLAEQLYELRDKSLDGDRDPINCW